MKDRKFKCVKTMNRLMRKSIAVKLEKCSIDKGKSNSNKTVP